jgi:hypothetical protein
MLSPNTHSRIEIENVMSSLIRKTFVEISKTRSSILIFAIILAVYILSSFDVCWFPGKGLDKGFVFSSNWAEHLHSSEEWTIYYQTNAFYEGRIWLSEYSPPEFSVDSVKIGDYYYALTEPVTASLLLPFYTLGQLLFGAGFLVRSVVVGMIFYTCVSAFLVRKISFQMNQSHPTANITALVFAFATMAFSYSRLLYPQPIVTMLMLFTIVFLFSYKTKRDLANLFCFALFYALTVLSFNVFIITAPFFIYFLFKNGLGLKSGQLLTIGLGFLPSIMSFVIWNYATTGNVLMTPRQIVHPTMGFDLLYPATGFTWLNLGGLFGSLFSPVGIFFVSPILFASLFCFSTFKSKLKDETILLASIIIVSWLFFSFANLGGNVGRDFWVGGWANIARYMYIPSTLLAIFASGIFEKINQTRNLFEAWIVSLVIILSFLANLSYGVHHDLMVGLLKDFPSTSLLVWPYQLGPTELAILAVIILFGSSAYPICLFMNKRTHLRNEKKYLQPSIGIIEHRTNHSEISARLCSRSIGPLKDTFSHTS